MVRCQLFKNPTWLPSDKDTTCKDGSKINIGYIAWGKTYFKLRPLAKVANGYSARCRSGNKCSAYETDGVCCKGWLKIVNNKFSGWTDDAPELCNCVNQTVKMKLYSDVFVNAA